MKKKSIFVVVVLLVLLFAGCSVSQKNQISIKQTSQQAQQTPNTKDFKGVQTDAHKDDTVKKKTIDSQKVAFVYPSKTLNKYAYEAFNTMLAYMFTLNSPFELESFDTINESQQNITRTLKKVIDKGHTKVILFLSENDLSSIENIPSFEKLNIYIPILFKKESTLKAKNVIYGGLDYNLQVQKLLSIEKMKKSFEIIDNSFISQKISSVLHANTQGIQSQKIASYTNFRRLFSQNVYDDSLIFLNTPVVLSSIFLSQVVANEVYPRFIFSSQINYNPIILSLTQSEDRKKLVIANSIGPINKKAKEFASFFDSSTQYNWVNYSTMVGIDYLLENTQLSYTIQNNQLQYDTKLYSVSQSSFQEFDLQEHYDMLIQEQNERDKN